MQIASLSVDLLRSLVPQHAELHNAQALCSPTARNSLMQGCYRARGRFRCTARARWRSCCRAIWIWSASVWSVGRWDARRSPADQSWASLPREQSCGRAGLSHDDSQQCGHAELHHARLPRAMRGAVQPVYAVLKAIAGIRTELLIDARHVRLQAVAGLIRVCAPQVAALARPRPCCASASTTSCVPCHALLKSVLACTSNV